MANGESDLSRGSPYWRKRSEQVKQGPQPSQPQLGDFGPRQAPSLPRIQQAEQQQLPFQGTMSVRRPGAPTFEQTGIGKFFNPRNVNGKQFNQPAIQHAGQQIVLAHTRAQYFRRAGFGAALRHTLGMEQVPSHVTDYLNAQARGKYQTGLDPRPLYGHHTDSYEPWHTTANPERMAPGEW